MMKSTIALMAFLISHYALADCDGICNKKSPSKTGTKVSIDSILSDSNEAMYNSLPDKSLVTKKNASKSGDEIVTIFEKSDATMTCTKTKTEFSLAAKKPPVYSYSCQEK